MRLKPPALLTGPYDWDPTVLPLQEFETRLNNVRQACARAAIPALIVHGNSSEHGALAYLTNFVPKLGPAFALVAPNGPVRVLVSGSPTMISAAKRLTCIDDVRPMGDLKCSVAAWLDEIDVQENAKIAIWGGSKMALRPYNAIKSATGSARAFADITIDLESLRLRKSAIELDLCRHACGILRPSVSALTSAFHSGLGARSVALAAEQMAYRSGAQDARAYVSARPGGHPVFIDSSDDPVIDPSLARIAVRFAGYWAEGFFTLTQSGSPVLTHAQEGLAATLKNVCAGVTFEELTSIAAKKVSPYKLHPLVENSIGNSIGLSIEQPCERGVEVFKTIQLGGIYTLRCGASGEDADSAIVSAMVSVGEQRTEILWSAPGDSAVSPQ